MLVRVKVDALGQPERTRRLHAERHERSNV